MAADTGIADDGATQLNLPSVAQQSTLAPTDHGDGSYTWDEILRHLVGFQRTHKIAHATGGRDAIAPGDIGAVAGTLDTDGTLAANSDTRVPSQKAVKTYADLKTAKSILTAKGSSYRATAAGAPADHAPGNDGEVEIYDSSASDGVRNASFNLAKALNGLLGWTQDPETLGNASGNLSAATLYVARIPLYRQISVTNVIAYLGTVGVSLTHAYGLLYKSDGTLIGQSADQSASWIAGSAPAGVGLKTIALASGPFLCTPSQANDWVWGALYVGTAGTPPQFLRPSAVAAALTNVGLSAAQSRGATIAVADTATPGNFTPSSLVQLSSVNWMALS